MKYYTFHIDDSGAVEDQDEVEINGEQILSCKLYDDDEFNKLNDIIHSLDDYILNKKALDIFLAVNTIEYKLRKVQLLRKEKYSGFLKKYVPYEYFQLKFMREKSDESYDWIDFDKSTVYGVDKENNKIEIRSHQQTLEIIESNKAGSGIGYSIQAEKITFGENFDSKIDLFVIPLYSWGIYISERLKSNLEEENITGIGFASSKEQLGQVWKPHFPIIEFAE